MNLGRQIGKLFEMLQKFEVPVKNAYLRLKSFLALFFIALFFFFVFYLFSQE